METSVIGSSSLDRRCGCIDVLVSVVPHLHTTPRFLRYTHTRFCHLYLTRARMHTLPACTHAHTHPHAFTHTGYTHTHTRASPACYLPPPPPPVQTFHETIMCGNKFEQLFCVETESVTFTPPALTTYTYSCVRHFAFVCVLQHDIVRQELAFCASQYFPTHAWTFCPGHDLQGLNMYVCDLYAFVRQLQVGRVRHMT